MLPEITYKQIRNVEFPIFVLPNGDLDYRDGLLMINGKVVDDKNMPGATLGIRRLQTPHKTKRLTKAAKDLAGLLASNRLNFIDNKGRIFHYKKTKFLEVIYHKIKKVQLKDTYSMLYAVGVETGFIIQRPPQEGEEWVGVLYLSHKYPWEIYELSTQYKPNSKKKV